MDDATTVEEPGLKKREFQLIISVDYQLKIKEQWMGAKKSPGNVAISQIRGRIFNIYDLSHLFVSLDGDSYLSFDPKTLLSYVDNDIHLTEPALRLIAPVYENITKELFS
ncbi:unnamed protein product [Caenorhabditis auriculariae]|uniref:Uncharacterized protein n=1 Tax=Caenorhabditis auriculariae TaxID=2777116 RepID=A0A8S1HF83_9PELO|nr:unnamed protein product [Caenorhabditis auriculariae]